MRTAIKTVLISVSDKTGIVAFAQALAKKNIRILATGGTAQLLKEHRIAVIPVSEYTQFPEILDGRVKTLHPKLFAGLLHRGPQDEAVLGQHEINQIDMIIINLYPFQETIANRECPLEKALENIDIGGPAMIRAAAKNFQRVAVLVNPEQYQSALHALQTNQFTLSQDYRFSLAQAAFAYTARYEMSISQYLNETDSTFPPVFAPQFTKIQDLRYGENPQQKAAWYLTTSEKLGTIAEADRMQGKPCSYNNICDADTAWECAIHFDKPACVIVKHANPCGAACDNKPEIAYEKAYATDPLSAFGGVIAFNREVDSTTAEKILATQFAEVIIAPCFTQQALALFKSKPNLRVLRIPNEPKLTERASLLAYHQVGTGILIQQTDQNMHLADLKTVTQRAPSHEQTQDLLFAWNVVRFVKSNAIVYAKKATTVAIGAGQMSRVFSAQIAILKAEQSKLNLVGSVMASDAFLPFPDTIELVAKQGISAIIQPGGSLRDAEVIQAANQANLAMIFTGTRHFRH